MPKATCDVLFYSQMDAPLAGRLWLAATERGLCAVNFGGEEAGFVAALQRIWGVRPLENIDALAEAAAQLGDYLSGKQESFDLRLDLSPLSEFQSQVLGATMAIPRGQTRTYRFLAESLGRPKAIRAVGGVEAANPIPIVIPCHRVVGSNGSLTGYGGGIDLKMALLRLEGAML
jgi:O-6-methylguanine DNA methyltransferase